LEEERQALVDTVSSSVETAMISMVDGVVTARL
jgi:hypothetical protein